jgi:hypothetical protein
MLKDAETFDIVAVIGAQSGQPKLFSLIFPTDILIYQRRWCLVLLQMWLNGYIQKGLYINNMHQLLKRNNQHMRQKSLWSIQLASCISITFWIRGRHLDCRIHGYCSSSMLYHQEKNSRTKHVEQLRKIKFFSVQQRYRIIYSAMYDYISNSGIRAGVSCFCVFFLEFEK